MNYIVMDLEWNQPLSPQRLVRDPIRLSGEIIQFGAVKIDSLEDVRIIDKYTQFVKPVYYPKMNKYVTNVTDITDEMLDSARPFKDVCEDFIKWCGEEFVFVTWSPNDIYMLEDNMMIHDMDYKVLPECYDLQLVFDDQITQDCSNKALAYAMWKLGIKPDRSHDALNDAINTIRVMSKLDLSEGLEGYEV